MRTSRNPLRRRSLGNRFRTHQRALGAAFAAVAVFLTVSAVKPAAAETMSVVTAARDIPSGHVIAADDLSVQQWPTEVAGALPLASQDELIGRPSTGPITSAELITVNRVVGPHLLDQINTGTRTSGDLVAAPVRLADPAQARLLQGGDLIDVIAARPTDSNGQQANSVAVGAVVLSVPTPPKDSGSGGFMSGSTSPSVGNSNGSLIMVAVDQATAIDLAAASTRSQLSVVLKRGLN